MSQQDKANEVRTPAETSPRTDGPDGQVVVVPGQMGSQQLRVPGSLPLLAVRETVIFPGTVVPLQVGRERSKRVIDEVAPGDKMIGVVAQKDPKVETPGPDDLQAWGTVCIVLKVLRLPDASQSLVVTGVSRLRVRSIVSTEPVLRAVVEVVPDRVHAGREMDALVHGVKQMARRLIDLTPGVPSEASGALDEIENPGQVADFLAANLLSEHDERQKLLETPDVTERLQYITNVLTRQLDTAELSAKIQDQVKQSIDKTQREYVLQEQLKAIQKELGQEDGRDEVRLLRQKLAEARPPEAVRKEAERELNRLASIPQASPEYTVIRTYLEWVSELPWSVSTEDKLDINRAARILDEDHYDLSKIKQRILEFLAIRKLNPTGRGPILCFIGPPGVGKTSLGQSIARALGRKFIRMSLGGIRDEADIRGHRRTYIGALPGRIIQEIRKAGANNPLFMLDEIDKIGMDFRGDPASALLEVLDPAQNNTFTDHYLDVPFDLSRVMFIATGNVVDPIPPALQDRMEMIHLPGYTAADKLLIAKRYLVPRQLSEAGLDRERCRFTEAGIRRIITDYTREAGVRNLERNIAAICRATAARVVRGEADSVSVTPKLVEQTLGPVKVHHDAVERKSVPGIAVGLAYTPAGGEIIFVEAAAMLGRGRMSLTGQIGDVMRESATAAFSLLRSRADILGIDPRRLAEQDIHIHVPAGAVPKDGPSAGVAMMTALASLILNRPVKPRLAMTGEITLRGLVLPVGGIKEKVLAARQAGVTSVILPRANEGDLTEMRKDDPHLSQGMRFIMAEKVDDVLTEALGVKARPRKTRSKKKRSTDKNAESESQNAESGPEDPV